ncbi:MAG: hypothetical protein C4567_13975 [Deltaproteobacteria bacterium]|nr:MAG: hypothetical protein C4567_13975 [Deltaproteobacteria bacterium]
MKKSYAVAGIMILAAVLLVLPVGAKAEMYVEAYLGASLPDNMNDRTAIVAHNFGQVAAGNFPGHPQPAVIGGVKIGTWFVKEGFLGYNYPDWMKYLGFYLDFSYHRLDLKNQNFNTGIFAGGALVGFNNTDFRSEGTAATLAFMFAARYGFFKDSEVPFGRLQPYIGVGPAIMWTTQEPKVTFRSTGHNVDFDSEGSTNIALAVDAGVRYMALKNVSLDLSFRYRYTNPSYSYTGVISGPGQSTASFRYEPTLNLFSVQLGAAYHF